MADIPELIGFFSYSREDDDDSQGSLSALRDRIQRELRGQLGRSMKTFRLWQDKEAIASGTLWQNELKNAVEQSVFFIPIITPTVVRSPYCRFELESFLGREAALERNDLVFPILYIRVPELEDNERQSNDPVLSIIAQRQYLDWREFRHRDVSSTDVRTAIERFCANICDALHRQWVSPEVRRARDESAAVERAEAERKREEAATRERAEAERQREEAAARERAEVERQREEAAARERAEAERKREEVAARERAEAERKREVAAARDRADAQAAAHDEVEPQQTGQGTTPVDIAERRSAPIEPSTNQAAQWRFGAYAARATSPGPPAGMGAQPLLVGGAIAAALLVMIAFVSFTSPKVEEAELAPLPSLPSLPPLPPLASLEWPTGPVTVAVGAAAGGTSDLVAREVALSLSRQIGEAVTVQNQPGAAASYAKMTLSGDTLLLLTTAHAVDMSVNKNPGFDILTDFVPIGGIAEMPLLMLVSPGMPAKSLSEFIAYAKANRTSVRMGLTGFPGNPRLPAELFMMLTGLNLPVVSTRATISSSDTFADLLAGRIQVAFAVADRSTLDFVQTGKPRVLAVTTKRRHEAFPGVPAAAESIPGLEASVWFGLGASQSTLEADVETMRRKIPPALADPTLKARLAPLGMTVIAESPAEFGKRVASEVEKWERVVRTRGIARF